MNRKTLRWLTAFTEYTLNSAHVEALAKDPWPAQRDRRGRQADVDIQARECDVITCEPHGWRGRKGRFTGMSQTPETGQRRAAVEQHAPEAATAPYRFSDQIGHLLRKAYHRHLAIFQANASDERLTSVQFVTLCALRDNGPSTQGDLSRATSIDQATIRGIIERLAARELITVQTDATDRRKVSIHLLAAGADLVARMIPCARLITEQTFGELDAVERVALAMVLRKMIDGPPGS